MQSSSPEGPERRQNRLLELCSRDLDHDLTSREKAEYAALRGEFPGTAERFESDARGLGGLLRQLTVSDVPAALQQSVATKIRQVRPKLTRSSTAKPAAEQRGRWLVAGISLSSLALGLIATVLLKGVAPGPAVLPQLASGDVASAEAPAMAANLPSRSVFHEKINVPPLPGEKIIVNAEDWQIVVIRVDSADRNAMQRQLAATKNLPSMEIAQHAAARATEPANSAYDFILTSDRVESRTFVDAVVEAGIGYEAEWNPETIADMDPESLIRSVLESMQSPSLSEQHFGNMYLATAKGGVTTQLLADADQDPTASADDESQTTETDSSRPPLIADNGANAQSDADARSRAAGSEALPTGEAHDPGSSVSGPPDDVTSSTVIASGSRQPSENAAVVTREGHYVLVVLEFDSTNSAPDCEIPTIQL